MKKKYIFLLSIIQIGCFEFEKSESLISEYKLNNGQSIRAYSIGSGATTKDHVEIRLQKSQNAILIKKIEGFGGKYKTDIVKINDTLFKIMFIDTTTFKGHINEFQFSINIK